MCHAQTRNKPMHNNILHLFSVIGFKCLKSFFETVNIAEHKIRRNGPTIIVDKYDLTGLSYLWQLILESPYSHIAEDATKFLINVSYTSLAAKLKKVILLVDIGGCLFMHEFSCGCYAGNKIYGDIKI